MPSDYLNDGPSPVQARLIDAHAAILGQAEPNDRFFNHAVLCQTSLPYRTKAGQRAWHRTQGKVSLHLQAGYAPSSPGGHEMEPVPLPAGPRARLVLIHIMSQAVLKQDPVVTLDDEHGNNSLTAFAKQLELDTNGKTLRRLREQLRRLAACQVRLVQPDRATGSTEVMQGHFVSRLQVFMPSHPGQRVLWPSFIELDHDFFESLTKHAVPLDPRALSSLKHSSSCLDTYQWLAQRLYRIRKRGGQLISWRALHQQLGGGTKHAGAWRQDFLGVHKRKVKTEGLQGTLPKVLHVYPAAREAIEITPKGLILRQAAPPIPQWGRVQKRRLEAL